MCVPLCVCIRTCVRVYVCSSEPLSLWLCLSALLARMPVHQCIRRMVLLCLCCCCPSCRLNISVHPVTVVLCVSAINRHIPFFGDEPLDDAKLHAAVEEVRVRVATTRLLLSPILHTEMLFEVSASSLCDPLSPFTCVCAM